MFLGKLSVLALLARIFTLSNRPFKIGVYFWATWIFLWWTASWFIVFLECRPLSTSWGVPYQCRPSFTTSICAAVFNVISDFGILILPQPLIWTLRLSYGKKLAISLVFLVGILCVYFPWTVYLIENPLTQPQCHSNQYYTNSPDQGSHFSVELR